MGGGENDFDEWAKTDDEAKAATQHEGRPTAPVDGALPLDLMLGQRAVGIMVLEWLKAGPGRIPRPAFSDLLDQAASAKPFHSWAGKSISRPPSASNSVARS